MIAIITNTKYDYYKTKLCTCKNVQKCNCNVAIDDDGKALFCLTKDNQLIDYTEE